MRPDRPDGGPAEFFEGNLMVPIARGVRRWLGSLVGPYLCASCGGPLRRLVAVDLDPGAVRTYRLAGTLGGLLASGYVCAHCTRPGAWILIE